MQKPILLWFKRDLRVVDHAPLARAAAMGPVLPLFIWEPMAWQQGDVAGRQFDFVAECVDDLRDDLARLGLDLCERVGPAVDVLEDLRRDTGFAQMISHEETGNGWSFARDIEVGAWASANGVAWEEMAGAGVVRRLNGRDGWAKRRNAFVARPLEAVGAVIGAAPHPSHARPDWLRGDHCPHRQRGGRRAALATLDSFLNERGRPYRAAMSSPLGGERGCSRLSPHLAFGTLSGREAAQAASARAQGEIDGTWRKSLQSFQARLAWRDHFMQKLEDEPALEYRAMHPACEDLRPKIPDTARLEAWAKGETGLPFVDACMRYVAATGWLNFRMRAMVTAVASYHLWLDWRASGQVLARLFTDYEPGIHWPQVQMQSGTTGMNTVRIYNPVKQGADQDPQGVFTRRWVPELAQVPDVHLQTPWTWEGAARLHYPPPIVDVAQAAREARAAVFAVRKSDGFRAVAGKIVEKHASRKSEDSRFVDDRAPRRKARKAADPRQQGFDF